MLYHTAPHSYEDGIMLRTQEPSEEGLKSTSKPLPLFTKIVTSQAIILE